MTVEKIDVMFCWRTNVEIRPYAIEPSWSSVHNWTLLEQRTTYLLFIVIYCTAICINNVNCTTKTILSVQLSSFSTNEFTALRSDPFFWKVKNQMGIYIMFISKHWRLQKCKHSSVFHAAEWSSNLNGDDWM